MMRIGDMPAALGRIISIPRDNPDLLKAQYAALTSLLPPMYFVLVVSGWALSASFMGQAPGWLTIFCPLLLTSICTIRLITWWRRGEDTTITAAAAIQVLERTNLLAFLLSAAFSAWAITLFPYGNDYSRGHVVLFLAITITGCMACLLHLRSAALILAAILSIALIAISNLSGHPTIVFMAVNVMLVTFAMLIVLFTQNRDFYRMIVAQTEAMTLIAENQRREQEQYRLLRMIDDMPMAVMTVDPVTFEINYVNEASKDVLRQIEDLLPIRADEIVGTSIDVFHKHPEHQRRLLSNPANLPHRTRIKLGPEVLDLQASPVHATDGKYIGPMLTWSIVTQHVEAERRILQLAHYDTLTGLANRATFRVKLETSLTRTGSEVGLLFVDLDGFKMINDSKGHLVGDALLKQVADRLRKECNYPGVTIGRLGGDEFAILLEHCPAERQIAVAGALIDVLVAPYHLEMDRHVQIGASIGIAHAPLHGDDAETLLARADIALYAAKAASKGTFMVFSPEMEMRIRERVQLESQLRAALDEEAGLFVFYQPIVDIRTRRVTAREALVRWHHPQRGWISPGEFIPVAEESGLIDRLGAFVLRRACHDAAGWHDGARVAVNISPAQLGKGTVAPAVQTALSESGLPPERLEVEVTESALLNEVFDCIADLRQVRKIGVRVALDDFGTGFSSLAHLRAFPFDKIKIDGSFVQDAVTRPDCAAVVKAIADLGKRLGVTTVAEGVETLAHFERVAAEGCSEVQGYLFGKPMPNEGEVPLVQEIDLPRPAVAAV